jgi:hypothetical protein
MPTDTGWTRYARERYARPTGGSSGRSSPWRIGCNRHSPATGPLPNRYSGVGGTATEPLPIRHPSQRRPERVSLAPHDPFCQQSCAQIPYRSRLPVDRKCAKTPQAPRDSATEALPIRHHSAATSAYQPASRGHTESVVTNQLLYQLCYAGSRRSAAQSNRAIESRATTANLRLRSRGLFSVALRSPRFWYLSTRAGWANRGPNR